MKEEFGSTIELINGTEMLIFYGPVKLASTTWAVLLMESYYSGYNETSPSGKKKDP